MKMWNVSKRKITPPKTKAYNGSPTQQENTATGGGLQKAV